MVIGLLVAFGVVLVVFLVVRLATVERRLEQLHERLDALGDRPQPAPPAAPPAPAPPEAVTVEPAPPPPPTAEAVEAPAPQIVPPRRPKIDFEQLVGGVWLQNVGAVLLLVGFFFLILWGYATGRFGPEMLVIAGVLAGLGLVWRGARMRLSAEGVGHALIGVGAGVVWLAIYVGHFKLRVLPPPVAFAFVVAASVFTGALGIRYGVQLIAALGVVGAHLPGLMKALMPLYGFTLPASGLLAYLAGLNALVFTLAARMGWSALALASLILTASTWALVVPDSSWSWGTEIGLAVLFAGLGLVPLLRLVRTDGPVRPVDLAVVAVAPLALLVASTPMFQLSAPVHVAMLLGSLAAIYTAAAAWVDQRRPDRDLWRPLVAAAILFLTYALERAVGPERTALAWILEGCALVILGRRPRAEWLRWCGYVVVMIGGIRLLPDILYGFDNWVVPLANADAITSGIAIVALLGVPYVLLRDDDRMGLPEQVVVHAWLVSAHLVLMLWLAREAGNLAYSLEGDGGAWRGDRDIRAAGSSAREGGLFVRLIALAWMAQAAWLVHGGVRGGRLVLRLVGYGIAALVTSALVIVPVVQDSWALDLLPILHRDGLLALATIGIAITMAAYLARNRDALLTVERRIAEVWAAAAALMMLTWISREADHITRTMLDVPGRMTSAWSDVAIDARQRLRAVAGTITSVGWILQAMISFVIGWFARSAFMRWMGMGLVGITVLKFLIVDLAQADPFWRFLIAIMAGAAMLALSYVYQRRARKSG